MDYELIKGWIPIRSLRWVLFGLIPALLFSINTNAQGKLEELEKELVELTSDSARMIKMKELVKHYRKRNPDRHKELSTEGLALAEQKNDTLLQVVFNREMGMYFKYKTQPDSALAYLHKALGLASKLTNRLPYQGTLIEIADVQKKRGNYDEAAKAYFETIKYFEENKMSDGLVSCYLGLASIYEIQKDYQNALDVTRKCLKSCGQLGKREIPCNSVVYTNLTAFFTALNQPDSALFYGLKARDMKERMGDQVGLLYIYHNLYRIYADREDIDQAQFYLNQEITIARSINNTEGMIRAYHGLGEVFLARSQFDSARIALDSAAAWVSATGNPFQQKDNLRHLATLYEKTGNHEQALLYLKQFSQVKDSLYNQSKQEIIGELETRYGTEKLKQEKLLEAEKATQNRNLLIGSVIIFSLLLILAGIIVYQIQQRRKVELVTVQLRETENKLKLERQVNQAELTALRAQMNPHFLFNAFNSIQEFIILNQKELASDYLGQFADLMRLYLDHSREKTITLEDEVKAAELYLTLEKVRFEDTLNYSLTVDPNIDPSAIRIPPMLIQPYLENAIKHGLLHKKENRKLNLSFTQQGEQLRCLIQDNGIGRKAAEEINQKRNKTHRSFATSANQNRIDLMNQSRKKPITVNITDGENGEGTQVELIIPL
ncbi:histidine kinase [bacterium SCSIO 12741]|nr:histidine kinase [bacterium SCSIO 12741]